MTITVFSKTRCPQCDATKRYLNKEGFDYSEVDIASSPSDLERFLAQGHKAAPIVDVELADGSHRVWSGFRLDNLRDLKTA